MEESDNEDLDKKKMKAPRQKSEPKSDDESDLSPSTDELSSKPSFESPKEIEKTESVPTPTQSGVFPPTPAMNDVKTNMRNTRNSDNKSIDEMEEDSSPNGTLIPVTTR